MKESIFDNFPHPFNYFLKELSDYIIVYYDENYNILDFNNEFVKIFLFDKKKLKTNKISDILTEKSFDKISKGIEKELKYKRRILEFKKYLKNHKFYNKYECYQFKIDNQYCLIGKKETQTKIEIINKVSKLNNELSNKTRELNKKNAKLEEVNKKVEELNRTDPLTKLNNRRYFMENFENVISRAKRHNETLSLIICDLDKFKDINDNYGHDVGDKVLVAVGKVLEKENRKEDIVARIGGEEFAILLNNTSIQNGKNNAERIRKKVSQIDIEKVSKEITISLGITELKKSDDKDIFFKRADTALYKAKNSGRNKVCEL